jgi:putative transposase
VKSTQPAAAAPKRGEPSDLAALLDEQTVAAPTETAQARAADGGPNLLGSRGLLQSLTKRIIEAALEAQLEEHLAAGRAGQSSGSERKGRRGKKIATEVGPMSAIVPRDRAGSFAPAVVRKSARRTSGIDKVVISQVGKGLTTALPQN